MKAILILFAFAQVSIAGTEGNHKNCESVIKDIVAATQRETFARAALRQRPDDAGLREQVRMAREEREDLVVRSHVICTDA